jgi:hypothetical protein
MNRALYIIVVPVLLVTLGYILVFNYIGLAPGYPRLIAAMILLYSAIWCLGRKTARKAGAGRQ